MGHHIRAVAGEREAVLALSRGWVEAQVVELPQDFALLFLTDGLWEQIEEAIPWATSRPTTYFSGHGTQAAVLLEGGEVVLGPVEGEGTINRVLRALGVVSQAGKDEFDTLGLGNYRHMEPF
ncbi:MAG: hypothetical protein HFF10_00175 [Angelakisella sp.]|jgi:hypothetical protein|nr:hypothetical protein [Angelakisella sp.]